jgi:hypothetical protein
MTDGSFYNISWRRQPVIVTEDINVIKALGGLAFLPVKFKRKAEDIGDVVFSPAATFRFEYYDLPSASVTTGRAYRAFSMDIALEVAFYCAIGICWDSTSGGVTPILPLIEEGKEAVW